MSDSTGRGIKDIMGYRSIIIILAVLEALMSAYLMKQGMPATAGRKADRFIYFITGFIN